MRHVHFTRGRTAAGVAALIALAALTQSAQPPLDLVIRVHQAVISVGTKHRPFAISNVRVFDGERAHVNLNVVVDNGIIRAVDPTLDKLRDVPTIDGSGATLLPGLLDAHAHPRMLEAPREALRFGVTTMLDMGSAGNEQLLRDAAASRSDVADLRSAGFYAPHLAAAEPSTGM